MTDCELCREKYDDHEHRLSEVERRQDAQGDKLDAISRDVIAVRAEGNARAATAQAGMERISSDVKELTRQLAEHTGAAQERNRIDKERLTIEQTKLARTKKYVAIVGLIVTIAGTTFATILSSQTWDDYFFSNVSFLHKRHGG